ncbi:phosphoribosylamine-glycine ligase [Phlyctema vagabunda]|uniref:Phosphoribosylamine-glycine ligase n=1 Tax=Phlyctema vagabunda TaxID=108571 RepID=A0ABR4PEG4_9HELO
MPFGTRSRPRRSGAHLLPHNILIIFPRPSACCGSFCRVTHPPSQLNRGAVNTGALDSATICAGLTVAQILSEVYPSFYSHTSTQRQALLLQRPHATMPLRILVIGSGAMESALIWKLATGRQVDRIIVITGNAGTATLNSSKVANVDHIKCNDIPAILQLVEILRINLVIPGASVPVDTGLESYFHKMNIACFAPTKAAAQIRSSRSYAKEFILRYNIPAIQIRTFYDFDMAVDYIGSWQPRRKLAITASTMHGVEVTITKRPAEAIQELREFRKRYPGVTKGSIIVKEHVEGVELCVLVISDEEGYKAFPPVQICSGGAGCYSPCEVLTIKGQAAIDSQIIQRTLEGLKSDGTSFRGFLTLTILVAPDGPRLKSFTTPHPELVIATMISLLESQVDLSAIILNCCNRRIQCSPISLIRRYTCSVVLSTKMRRTRNTIQTKDIPSELQDLTPMGGDLSAGFYCEEDSRHVLFFHHHTKFLFNQQKNPPNASPSERTTIQCIPLVNTERVMVVTAVARTLERAVRTAEDAVSMVEFRGLSYDKGLGARALEMEQSIISNRQRLKMALLEAKRSDNKDIAEERISDFQWFG